MVVLIVDYIIIALASVIFAYLIGLGIPIAWIIGYFEKRVEQSHDETVDILNDIYYNK